MPAYLFTAFMGYTLLFVIVQQVVAIRRGARNARGRGDTIWHFVLLCVSISAMPWAVIAAKHQEVRYVPMYIGGAVVVIGLVVSIWAQWVLGSNWVGGVGLAPGHKPVTTGPYRYVRHPLYAGMLVSGVGLSIFGFNILFAVVAMMFTASFAVRGPSEDRLLAAKFKKRIAGYQASTGMFFPRLGRKV